MEDAVMQSVELEQLTHEAKKVSQSRSRTILAPYRSIFFPAFNLAWILFISLFFHFLIV